MNEPLPHFRYHPDPVASGSVVARQVRCACCRQQRRFIYVGPVYATQDFTEKICPWCIASGAAARDLKAEFSDAESLASQDVPAEVIEEVVARTPGYVSWQGSEWLAHCKDACAFLGDAAVEDVRSAAESTVSDWCATNRQDRQGWLAATQDYVPGGQPAFYKFQCLHCNKVRLGWDFH
jgi:uncharacterized protein